MKTVYKIKDKIHNGKLTLFYGTAIVTVIVSILDLFLLFAHSKNAFLYTNIVSVGVIIIFTTLFLLKKTTLRVSFLAIAIAIVSNSILSDYINLELIHAASIFRECFFMVLLFTILTLEVHRFCNIFFTIIYTVHLLILNAIVDDVFLSDNIFMILFVFVVFAAVFSFFVNMLETSINNLEKQNEEIKSQNEEIQVQNEELKSYQEEILTQRSKIEDNYNFISEVNDKLEVSNEKLSEANDSKSKMISIIAHDIKNPLYTVKGFADLLLKRYEKLTNEKRLLYIENIKQTIDRLGMLLDNLLLWSNSQLDRITVKKDIIDAGINMQVVFKELEYSINEKQIRFSYDIPQNTLVFADTDMFLLICRNLLTNAIKFTEKNGEITFNAKKEDDFILFIITDTGIGMREHTLRSILSNEKSISAKGTMGEKGTGLGLQLCMEFVKKNGGNIWAESEWEKGTTFYFTLPVPEIKN